METIKVESLYRSKKPNDFLLLEDVKVVLSDSATLTIPKGYITDFASVPKILWSIVGPVGNHNRACLIHDYLISGTTYSRVFADREFRYFLELDGVSPIKTKLMYYSVRVVRWIKEILNNK